MLVTRLVTLVPSRTTTETESVNVTEIDFSRVVAARFLLNVTAAATAGTDTFDAYLQSLMQLPAADGGAEVWDDFVHFTQVLGNDTEPVRYIAVWQAGGQTPESEMHAPQAAAISAGVVQGPIGPNVRARVVVVDDGADNASFTWALYAQITEDL